jgi:hypothetical protein
VSQSGFHVLHKCPSLCLQGQQAPKFRCDTPKPSENGSRKQSTEFCTSKGQLNDLGTVLAGFNAVRPHPTVHLQGGQWLWKSHDPKQLGWTSSIHPGSKHSPGGRSQRLVSVLSEPAQRFTSLHVEVRCFRGPGL